MLANVSVTIMSQHAVIPCEETMRSILSFLSALYRNKFITFLIFSEKTIRSESSLRYCV